MFHFYKLRPRCAKVMGMLLLGLSLASYTGYSQEKDSYEQEEYEHEKENERRREEEWKRTFDPKSTSKRHQDEKNRLNRQSKSSTNLRTEAVETLANGRLQGQWTERGSNSQSGRIRYSDYYAATGELYVVSDGGNLFRGDYNGNNWVCLNNSMKFQNPQFVKVLPNGSGKRILIGLSGSKYYYYSDNEGATWNTSTGLEGPASWGVLTKSVWLGDSQNTIFLLALEWDYSAAWRSIVSVYRSTDKGTSFTKLKSFVEPQYSDGDGYTAFSIWAPGKSHNYAYLITTDSVFTVSNTATINAVTPVVKHNLPIGRGVRLTGTLTGTSTITLNAFSNGQIYRSANGGSTWSGALNPPAGETNPWGGRYDAWFSMSAAANNATTLYWGGTEVYKGVFSSGSYTWTKINTWGEYYNAPATKLHADIPAIIPFMNGSTENVLICTDGGVYKSTNDLSSVSNLSLNGLNVSQYYGVYTPPNNTNFMYAGSQDQGCQFAQYTSGNWNFIQSMSGDNTRFYSSNGGKSIWHYGYDRVYFFTNGDVDTQVPNISYYFGASVGGAQFFPRMTVHPKKPDVAYFGGGVADGQSAHRIVKLVRNGLNITPSNMPYVFTNKVSGLVMSPLDTNNFYAITSDGTFYRSTNGGVSFTATSGFTGPSPDYNLGSTICLSKLQSGKLFIAGDGYNGTGVYMSTNHGANFTLLSTSDLPNTMVQDLELSPDESMLFAATQMGPYVYVFADSKWYNIRGTAGPDQVYMDVEYLASVNTIRFATYGRGVWDFVLQGGANQKPVVSLATNSPTYTALASIVMTATASDADGTISKVYFYNGSTRLSGAVTSSPYTYTWNSVAAGTYSNLKAVAYDNNGDSTASALVSVTVNAAGSCTDPQYVAGTTYATGAYVQNGGHKYQCTVGGWCSSAAAFAYAPGTGSAWQSAWTDLGVCAGSSNQKPTVSLSSGGTSFTAPATITLTATAADADGTISKVYFYNGNTRLGGAVTVSPYKYTWSNVAAGSYTFKAVAYDNSGDSTASSTVAVNVTAGSNANPTVSVTKPTANQVFRSLAAIRFEVNAADADGTVQSVTYSIAGQNYTVTGSNPFAYDWTPTAYGTYTVSATAKDNLNATSSVATASFKINQKPTASVSAGGTTFTAPANITLTATATDADGTIAKVYFYNGTTRLGGAVTASPYTYSWNNVAAGSYAVKAVAYDNNGDSTASSVVNLTVNTSGGTCTAQVWNATTAYSGGAVVQYNGIKYLASWWTQGEQPDTHTGSGQPWVSQGTCTSRLGEPTAMDFLKVIPNPVADAAIVYVNLPSEDNVYIEAFDITGREVLEVYKGKMTAGLHEFAINTSSLVNGAYMLVLRGDTGNISIRFVK